MSITATPGVDTTAFTVIPRAKRILQEQQTARPKRRRPRASSQRGMDTNALASLIFGSLGCVMACFWPIGLLCSTAGVIVGFIARNSHSRGPATVGFVLSAGSFIVGFGFMLVSITDIAVHGTSRTTEMKPRPFFR